MVQGLPSLQHLSLLAPRFGSLLGFPAGIITSCPLLRRLELRLCQVRALPPELGRLTALTRLELTDTGATSLPDSILRLTGLKELSLAGNCGLQLPDGLAACPKLTQLLVSSKSISSNLTTLQFLQCLGVRFSTSKVTPAQVDAMVQGLPSLQHLPLPTMGASHAVSLLLCAIMLLSLLTASMPL